MPRNPNKIEYSGRFPEGFEVFASIPDPRDGGKASHRRRGVERQPQRPKQPYARIERLGLRAGITLAQAFYGGKTNEITAIPKLFEILNLKGVVVTIDANPETPLLLVAGRGGSGRFPHAPLSYECACAASTCSR
jgi:hypothetical protein